VNLYGLVGNDPIQKFDVLGKWANFAIGVASSLTASAVEDLFDDFDDLDDPYAEDLFDKKDVAGEGMIKEWAGDCPEGSGELTWQTKRVGDGPNDILIHGSLQAKGIITWEYSGNSIFDLSAKDNGSISSMQINGVADDSGIVLFAKVSTSRKYNPCGCLANEGVATISFGGILFNDRGLGNEITVCEGEAKIYGQGGAKITKKLTCRTY
jgi:hypothetical protein